MEKQLTHPLEITPLKSDVIHVVSKERSQNWKYFEDAQSLLRDIQFIPIDDIPIYRKEGYKLPSHLSEGAVLFRHPFMESRYVHAVDASKQFRYARFLQVSEILQLLGASRYKIADVWEEVLERTWDVGGSLSYKIVKTSAEVKDQKTKKQKIGFALEDSFDGIKVITEDSWEQAWIVAERYGLADDCFIQGIINQRNPRLQNSIRHREYILETTSEESHMFDLAFSLTAFKKVFNLDASVNRAISTQQKIKLEVEYFFEGESSITGNNQ